MDRKPRKQQQNHPMTNTARRSSGHADRPNARTAAARRSIAAAAAAAARRRRPKVLRELERTPRVPLSQGGNTYGGHRHSVSVVQWCVSSRAKVLCTGAVDEGA